MDDIVYSHFVVVAPAVFNDAVGAHSRRWRYCLPVSEFMALFPIFVGQRTREIGLRLLSGGTQAHVNAVGIERRRAAWRLSGWIWPCSCARAYAADGWIALVSALMESLTLLAIDCFLDGVAMRCLLHPSLAGGCAVDPMVALA